MLTDFQKLNECDLASVETFFLALAELIADQLDLAAARETSGTRAAARTSISRFTCSAKCSGPPRRRRLGAGRGGSPLHVPLRQRVFGLFRSWHNERSLDPAGPWRRLTLAIAYATEAHLFITDLNQSPFNVGTRLALEDFTPAQVADLNGATVAPSQDGEVGRYFAWSGATPTWCAAASTSWRSDSRLDAWRLGRGRRRDLRRPPAPDADRAGAGPGAAQAMRAVLQGRPCPTAESFYRLRSAGVYRRFGGDARPRCRLYAAYLKGRL